jgi:hypothetical protein
MLGRLPATGTMMPHDHLAVTQSERASQPGTTGNSMSKDHPKDRNHGCHCGLLLGSGGHNFVQQHSESGFRHSISLHYRSRQIVRRP